MAIANLALTEDLVRDISLLLPDQEVCNAARVCKSWNNALERDKFWELFLAKKGIPMVEDIDTGLKKVFLNLHSRTISGEMFAECYGEVRDIPRLAKERYKMFVEQMDPFIPKSFPQQKISRTFYLVINPSHVYRPYDEKLYKKLNASKNKEDKSELLTNGAEMKIPFTLRNRVLLIQYPNHKIFSYFFLFDVFDQCNSLSEKTTLWLMREKAVLQEQYYNNQKRLVQKEGFQLTPLTVRVDFNAIKIRKTGTCPDSGRMNALVANTIKLYDKDTYPLFIGSYTSNMGIDLFYSLGNPHKCHGVVPGLPAEVRAPPPKA